MASTASIVDRIDEIRKRRAMAYAEQGRVLSTDDPDVYEVAGTNDRPYHVDLAAATCTCPDHQVRRHICKHLGAAYIWSQALDHIEHLAINGVMTFDEIHAALERQAEGTSNRDLEQKLRILARAAQSLSQDHDRIELIVEYRCCDRGRKIWKQDRGRLDEVIEADGTSREPYTPDAYDAQCWLNTNGYVRTILEWLDPARPLRRRREVYVR